VPIPCGSPLLRFFTSIEESLQVATSPCCHQDLLDVILRLFPWLLGPLPRRSHRVHVPVNFPDVIGLPLGRLGRLPALVHNATFRGNDSRLQTFRYVQATKFVRLPGCSHRYGSAVGRPRLLRPGRTCVVASARTGYASRPQLCRLLPSPIVPTAAAYRRRAAEAFTSELNMLRCLPMHRIC
jgi:hypothetical protein